MSTRRHPLRLLLSKCWLCKHKYFRPCSRPWSTCKLLNLKHHHRCQEIGLEIFNALSRLPFLKPWSRWIVTPSFKAKTRYSSYVCPGSSCHTYGQNVNTENQCLKYINFITQILSLHRRLYWHSRRAAAEHANHIGNQPGATQASRRNLHHRSPSHLRLLSSVTARVSRLMVATQQVKGKYNNIYAGSKQN
jgi:hypothetical protein